MALFRVNLLNRRDVLAALLVAVLGLAVFTRVLAPDVLYSDSGELQTLAYTWSTTHTTGYPVYLLLARIVTFLPVGTLAWRVNFASALFAALTLGGVYLITRHFTRAGGALVASIVLLFSYTFWSQSIIAEIYTLATACIVTIFLLLLLWSARPLKRRWLLFAAGFLLGAGLGIHMFILLVAPSVGLFVFWGVLAGGEQERGQWRQMVRFAAGGIAGLLFFFLLFAYMDARPTPTNLMTTSMLSSADVWDLQASDLDSLPERFWISVSGYQWRDRMIPTDMDYTQAFNSFVRENLSREYATPTVILAGIGLLAALLISRRLFALLALALLTTFAAGFLYFPGDKYIFYLPFYVLLAILCGIGAGTLVALVSRFLPARLPALIPAVSVSLLLVALCLAPFVASRWRSLQRGQTVFMSSDYDYVYPIRQPDEPRRAAECAVTKVTEAQAFLVLEWRALYSIYYVSHVEQGRTGLVIREALPYPAQAISPVLRAEMTERLRNGEAVYTDNTHPPLGSTFRLTPVTTPCADYRLFRVSLPD